MTKQDILPLATRIGELLELINLSSGAQRLAYLRELAILEAWIEAEDRKQWQPTSK